MLKTLKSIALAILFFGDGHGFVHGQTVYFNTQEGLYRFTGGPGSCAYTPLTSACGAELNYLSLAIFKDTVYYNTWGGDLKRFVIGVPGSCRTLILDGGTADNAMTVDKDGIIYTADRRLRRYDPHLNQLTDLGLMPFRSTGDLIFFRGKLLLAGYNPNDLTTGIYEIDINNVPASTLYMSTPAFVGLVSYPVACGNSRYFGISDPQNGTGSKLTEIDLVNKTIIGTSCSLSLEILDAASSTETGVDDNVAFTSVQITKSCQATTGTVQVIATYSSGPITYTLDNSITNTTGTFTNLSEGQHTIVASASNGACTNDTTFIIPSAGNLITGITAISPDNCNVNPGSIVFTAVSANPPITYTLVNSGLSQLSGIFSNLGGGVYNFHVTDAAGCAKDTTIRLNNPTATFINKIEVSPATCNEDNGQIKIIPAAGNSTAVSSINNSMFRPTFIYPGLSPGIYHLQVKDGSSCSFDTTIVIATDNTQANCTDIFIPTAFTPNDDGKNDFFTPSFPPTVRNIVLRLFNRWGEKVYEGKGNSVSWDGRFGGEKQPPSIYVYHLSFTDNTGAHKNLKGTVVLIR